MSAGTCGGIPAAKPNEACGRRRRGVQACNTLKSLLDFARFAGAEPELPRIFRLRGARSSRQFVVVHALDIQALCGQFDRREIAYGRFIEQCTRLIATAIGCSRAGIWLFEDAAEGRLLRCLGIYDRHTDRVTLVPDETSRQVGAYFAALEQAGHVLAVEARSHPATAGFFGEKLSANGVHSLMASAFSINGCLFGAFTCTEVERTMNWTPAQLALLKRIGARVSLALASATRIGSPTLPAPL